MCALPIYLKAGRTRRAKLPPGVKVPAFYSSLHQDVENRRPGELRVTRIIKPAGAFEYVWTLGAPKLERIGFHNLLSEIGRGTGEYWQARPKYALRLGSGSWEDHGFHVLVIADRLIQGMYALDCNPLEVVDDLVNEVVDVLRSKVEVHH